MGQKVTVTLKRFYFKEVEIEIDNELLKGMNQRRNFRLFNRRTSLRQ